MKKQRRSLIVITIVALAAAITIFWLWRSSKSDGGKAQTSVESTPIAITIVTPQRQELIQSISLTGTLRSDQELTLASEVMGRIVFMGAEEGDTVEARDLMVRIEDTTANALLDQVKSALSISETKLSQLKTAHELQKNQALAELRQAQEEHTVAQKRMGQARANIVLTDAQVDAQLTQAEATHDRMQANLELILSGARPQEKAQALAMAHQTKVNLTNANNHLTRAQELFRNDAIAKADLDEAERSYQNTKAAHDSSEAALSLLEAGPRPEEVTAARQQLKEVAAALTAARTGELRKALVRQDLEVAQAQVKQAEAALKLAKAGDLRTQVSFHEVEAARSASLQAKAVIRNAQAQLDKVTIHAPVSATVTRKLIKVGEITKPGQPLFELIGTEGLYMETSVPENDYLRVKPGQEVQVAVDTFPGKTLTGTILKVIPVADEATRRFRIRVALPQSHESLYPGTFARGELILRRVKNALTLPSKCIIYRNDRPSVFVAKDDRAVKTFVQLGMESSGLVDITGGLDTAKMVISPPFHHLRDGQKIRIVDKDPMTR